MTLYARNDIIRVSVPGGCGNPHTRPASGKLGPDGETLLVQVWGINCPPCETHLNDDVQWSKSQYKIPMTPDEEQDAEDERTRHEAALRYEQTRMARESYDRRSREAPESVQAVDPTEIAVTGPESASVSPESVGGVPAASNAGDYGALDKVALKNMARNRGLSVSGTKDDLIARHLEYDQKAAA